MSLLSPLCICLFLALAVSAHAADSPECVMTNTTCPCTITPSSGTCMRSQGDGTCLMGECSDGYKCDCFGFEQCNINKCAIHTTDANIVPSATEPFKCHLTPDAGNCVTFDHFLDTVSAADNAKAEASASVKETDMEMSAASDDLRKVQGYKVVLEQTFEDLDTFAERVTEAERAEVEQEAEQVVQATQEVQKEISALNADVAEAFTANLEAARYHRLARSKETQAVEKEKQEAVEMQKPENKESCVTCASLKEEIKQLRKERKEAAILAGTWTKKVQEAKNRSRVRRRKVNKVRLSAEEARARCLDHSQRILTRLRGERA